MEIREGIKFPFPYIAFGTPCRSKLNMKRLLLASSFALAASAAAAQPSVSPILAPLELEQLRESANVRVIDIRPPADYSKSHIPGAVSAPYAAWRGPAHSPGQLPELTQLTKLVQSLGVDETTHAVVVSTGETTTDFGAAARVYWTLKYLGLERLSVLNGGMQSWAAANLPQGHKPAQIQPNQYEPVLNEDILATRSDILDQIDNPKARLVDARPTAFFEGKTKAPTAAVPGTIRNAVNIEHSVWFKPGTNEVVSAGEAKRIAAERFPELADDTIAFCNTGHWAATDWFALSELAGLPNVRMYPESLAEWTNTAEALPMDNTPSRSSQLLEKLKNVIN